jgi:membrane protein implicated in regulation of membrane protease activity
VLTAGFGNPVIATGESTGALIVSVLALIAPWLAFGLAVIFCVAAYRLVRRLVKRRTKESQGKGP